MENVFIESFHVYIFHGKKLFSFFLRITIPTFKIIYFLEIFSKNIRTDVKTIISNISQIFEVYIFFFPSKSPLSKRFINTREEHVPKIHIITDVTQKMKRSNVQGTISNFLQPVEYRLSNISTCAVCYRARARCISRILMNFNLIIVGDS